MLRPQGRSIRSPLQHPEFAKLDFQSKMTVQLLEAHKAFLEAVKEHSANAKVVENLGLELQKHMSRINALPQGPKGDKGNSIQGEPGRDGQTPERGVHYMTDEDIKMLAGKAAGLVEVPELPQIPEVDTEQLASTVIAKILDGKTIKTKHIDGFEQTMASYRSQMVKGMGYVHGGGDTVGAGTGVTITNVNGTKVISTAGGSGINPQVPTGTIDSLNKTFVCVGLVKVAFVDGNPDTSAVITGAVNSTIVYSQPPQQYVFAF